MSQGPEFYTLQPLLVHQEFLFQSDAFHMSQGPEFCTLQPPLVHQDFFFSLMHSICPRNLNSVPISYPNFCTVQSKTAFHLERIAILMPLHVAEN